MARYRKVETRIWTDERVTRLSPDGRYVWLYCLTATESNMIGIYPFRRMVAIEDTGLDAQRFDAAFSEVTQCGLAVFDIDSKMLYIPGFLKINPPQSRNVGKGMAAAIMELPRTVLLSQLHARIESLAVENTEIWDELLRATTARCTESQPTVNGESRNAVSTPYQRRTEPRPNSGTVAVAGTVDLAGAVKDKTAPNGAVRPVNQSTIDFDRFWEAYPRKTAKQNAVKAWSKIRPDSDLIERILSAIALQRNSAQWRKDNGQFIPHAATWLNAHRWEDEPPMGPRSLAEAGRDWDEFTPEVPSANN